MAKAPLDPGDERIARALKLASLPGKTLKEAALRFGLPQAALRRAQKSGPPVRLTLDDLVLSGLGDARALAARDLLPYLDWADHAAYAEAEVEEVLRRLAARGLAAERDGGWIRAAEWP